MSHATVSELPRFGDKENSPFFEEYLPKIYARREAAGLHQLLRQMRAVVVQVETGDALSYMAELAVMGPYRFHRAFENATHRIFVLRVQPAYPDIIVLEPLNHAYEDHFSSVNRLYPRAAEKPHARYLGEIYQTISKTEARRILEAQQIRFMEEHPNAFLRHNTFLCTQPSYFTGNVVVYCEQDLTDYSTLDLGTEFHLGTEEQQTLAAADDLQKKQGIGDLVLGIDHLATRVLSGDREHAILEFMTMTNYYFWGAYNIEDMNSSTNVSRHPDITYELHSPAKVFTANNTPFYVQSFENLPSPTEDFVRNFGRRLHHMAYEVPDGETGGLKNIDFVVKTLNEKMSVPFLAQIIGECKDIPDLKQIFSKSSRYSLLITEYVQRCKNYQGFFSKKNVAALTAAAGLDESLDAVKKAHAVGVGDS